MTKDMFKWSGTFDIVSNSEQQVPFNQFPVQSVSEVIMKRKL